jgi:hypothetical protein
MLILYAGNMLKVTFDARHPVSILNVLSELAEFVDMCMTTFLTGGLSKFYQLAI